MVKREEDRERDEDREWVARSDIDRGYYDAVQSGEITLLVNLTRILGRRLEPIEAGERYIWETPDRGLIIYLNRKFGFMVIRHHNKIVCSTVHKPFFEKGPWWEYITKALEQIEAGKKNALRVLAAGAV